MQENHRPEAHKKTIPNKHRTPDEGFLPTPNELIALLSKRVIGQVEAKRAIAVAIYQHFLQCAQADVHGGRVESENHLLLVGPTGSGKSLLLRTLGDVLDIPVIHVACTNIMPNGYKGKDFSQHVESIAERLVTEQYTHPAIVVWDEVDKLGLFESGDTQAAVYKRMSQMDFLTYLDGTACGDDQRMDSSRILNIACGAFVGLEEIRRMTVPTIGFCTKPDVDAHNQLEPLSPRHLIKYGLIPEFVGRFARIAELESLDQTTLRRILTEAEDNVLARRKAFYALHGIRLEITDDALDALVKKVLLQKTGARALRLVVDQILGGMEHRLPDMAQEGVTAVVVDRDVVDGLSCPIEHRSGTPRNAATLIELRRIAAYGDAPDPSESTNLSIF